MLEGSHPNAPHPLATSLLPAVEAVVREAGATALKSFRPGAATSARLWYKGRGSPVTEADVAADEFLKRHLLRILPEAGWLSEETADDRSRLLRPSVWIVDPIDGTRAFMTGHPDWSISLALLFEGRPVLGIVFAPSHDHLYKATEGGGAHRNGTELHASEPAGPAGARVAGPKPLIEVLEKGAGAVVHLPKVPSLALRLARVAEGSIDIGLVSANANDWDLAAADLILHEARACLTGLDGVRPTYNRDEPVHGELIAAGARLHPRAIEAMRNMTFPAARPY
jgi:myo-inositol-1(or 4)-monophosphatase